jgi:Tol biopolymer transport system component
MVPAGSRVAAYDVVELIGAGGMGDVYRARDSRLDRDVALKFLRPNVANDPDRLARFRREAKVLASLNHPNIAQVYGLEECDGTYCIAMELIRGDTLAARLRHGPLPASEALRIASDIANALEAAHEKGIVHRDLKPANVMLQPDGQVKVLDFGLSKTKASSERDPDGSTTTELTNAGLVLGTAAYMSPEQARGAPTDQRTDIFSFGCVLYEMLTGERAFRGDTPEDVAASILARDPDLDRLPPAHPELRHLVRRCLEKSLRNRWQAIGDVRIEIERIVSDYVSGAGSRPVAPSRRPRWLAAAIAAAAIGIALFAAGSVWAIRARIASNPDAPVRRFSIQLDYVRPVISPDGRHIAYRSQNRLWIRDLSSDTSREIAGAEAKGGYYNDVGYYLAWSPDSRSLAFVAEGEVRRVPVPETAAVTTICQIPPTLRGTNRRVGGLAWSSDGNTLVFSRYGNGIYEVSSRGGVPTRLVEEDHADDMVLIDTPRGRAVAYAVLRAGTHELVVRTPEGERRSVAPLETNWPELVYSPTGHILFRKNPAESPTLWALPFSSSTLAATGDPFMVERSGQGMSLAGDGTLVYLDVGRSQGQVLGWRDRSGKLLAKGAENHGVIQVARLAPDGGQAVVAASDSGQSSLWLYDLQRFVRTRFPLGDEVEGKQIVYVVWPRRPSRILYALGDQKSGQLTIDSFSASLDGTGRHEKFPFPPVVTVAQDVSPDGRYLIAAHSEAGEAAHAWFIRLDEVDARPVDFSQNKEAEQAMMLSPNGRYLAYTSTISGRLQVYVRPFPEGSGRWQISTNGGAAPRWGGDGRELFFVEGDSLMRVGVSTGAKFSADTTPEKLFDHPALVGNGAPFARYDVAADARRILTVEFQREIPQPVVRIVENWLSEFRGRLAK